MKNKGFTLIEILTVTIVIGILTGIAIPNYLKSIEKTTKQEGTTTLQSIWTAEKIYHMDKRTYTDTLGDLNINVPSNNFNYSIDNASTTDFLARATKKDSSYTLTINAAGEISESTPSPAPHAPTEF